MIDSKHPPKVDVKHAAQSALHLEGHDLLLNYERLTQEVQGLGVQNALNWVASFDLRPDQIGHLASWLHLDIQVSLPQICQRCLGAVDVAIQIDREFRFVDSESTAEKQDDESEEDVLVMSREFDLATLIEDEVLMDLPLVARHDVCPVPVKLVAEDADFEGATEKPNPFAVLAKLKSPG
jgi:uncharacterized protein